MSTPFAPTAAAETQRQRAGFFVRGVRSMGFGVLIGVCLSLAFDYPLLSSMVHSVSISVACWFCIDSGRLLAARWANRNAPADFPPHKARNWPGWGWMVPVLVVGTVVGFSVGSSVADWITGRSSPGFLRGTFSHAVSLLMLALVPGLVITYWFYSRETIAAKEAAIQTAQRQAAEHQLKLLESQLEPHMLFNTLANLRVLIGMDPPRAQAMLDQLIAFLRATLAASRAGQHPLSAEFARIEDYLALMQVRMGERLRTRLTLPVELRDMPVPPLLLQPLVENCIKHGLEPNVAGGRVDVIAAREGDTLVLRVRDTGVGLCGPAGDSTRFGLVQVRERLATLYGTKASLQLGPAGDAHDTEGGTLATIRLPMGRDA